VYEMDSVPWTFSTAMTCHFRNRFLSFSGFFPMTGRVLPIWKEPAGATASPVPIVRKPENRSALQRGQESWPAVNAAAKWD